MVLAAHSARLPKLTGLMAESVLEPFPCTGWYLCSINFCFCLKMDYILQQLKCRNMSLLFSVL